MKYSPLKDTFDMRSHSGAPEIASSVVGMNVNDLKDFCEEYMIDVRYVKGERSERELFASGGQPRVVTRDYRTERLNVEVEGGVVTGAYYE